MYELDMASHKHIMVVDDEKELAKLFGIYLNNTGLKTTIFANPLQALKHFTQNHYTYSMIIIDFKMNSLNGLELAKRIRAINADVKIVIITAYPIREFMESNEFLQAKISAVLIKPIRLSELKNKINEIFYEQKTPICC